MHEFRKAFFKQRNLNSPRTPEPSPPNENVYWSLSSFIFAPRVILPFKTPYFIYLHKCIIQMWCFQELDDDIYVTE